jgi:hypothetical protein
LNSLKSSLYSLRALLDSCFCRLFPAHESWRRGRAASLRACGALEARTGERRRHFKGPRDHPHEDSPTILRRATQPSNPHVNQVSCIHALSCTIRTQITFTVLLNLEHAHSHYQRHFANLWAGTRLYIVDRQVGRLHDEQDTVAIRIAKAHPTVLRQ